MKTVRRWILLLLLGFSLLGVTAATAQTVDVPPQALSALAAFNQYLTQPITLDQLDAYQLTFGTYTDSALGCSLVAGAPLALPVNAFRVQLVYQSLIYEFEVSQDTTMIVPCSPALLTQPLILPVATPVVATIGLTGCPVDFSGYLPPRLTVGSFARIGTEGEPNRLRAAPTLDSEQLGLINPGTTVEVLDGPVCEPASHIVWWQVRDGSLTGYTAESQEADYFLDPVDLGSLRTLRGLREPITQANAAGLVTLAAMPLEGGTMVEFGGSGQLLVNEESGITLYDLDGITIRSVPLPRDTVILHADYSPNSQYVAYSTDSNALFVYDVSTGQTTQVELGENVVVNDLDFSMGNLLAVALGDPLGSSDAVNGWRIYEIGANAPVIDYPSDSWVGDVAFGPAGQRMAWLSDTANVAMLEGDVPVISGQIEQPTRTGLAWLPVEDVTDPNASYRIAYADGNVIQLFDIQTSELASFSNLEDYLPGTLAFSADGSVLAVMNRGVTDEPMPRTMKLFDVATGQLLYTEDLETARAMSVSPDGTLIAVLTDDALRFYGIAVAQTAAG